MHARSVPGFSAALLLLAVPWGASLRAQTLGGDDDPPGTHSVTVYQLWGSIEKPKEKPPKVLEKLVARLAKHTGKRTFHLAAKPEIRKVRLDESFRKKLPQKYSAEWTLISREGKLALRQKLTNPRKRSSVLLLKKRPVITELTKIRRESESFILVVDFGPAKKK